MNYYKVRHWVTKQHYFIRWVFYFLLYFYNIRKIAKSPYKITLNQYLKNA